MNIPNKLRMPAEWEPHDATWLTWPHNEAHWPGKFHPIPHTYVEIIQALAPHEKVHIMVNDDAMEKEARNVLRHLSSEILKQLRFFHIPADSSWTRDICPLFVYDDKGDLTATDFIFNGWGNKWPSHREAMVSSHIGKALHVPVIESKMVLEGGAIDVNGAGSVLTTEQCLLHPNRNPHMTKENIEKNLCKYLGVSQVLWLGEGIVGDDTDGHIDDLARFTDVNTIVTVVESNPKDENYIFLQDNLKRLKKMKNLQGTPFNIVELPMPSPVIHEGLRLPATYANFYIANNIVLMPTFRCDNDKVALNILQGLFPTRKIVAIDCTDFVWGNGTIHCSTQQQPATKGDRSSQG